MKSIEKPARWSSRRARISSRLLLPVALFEWANEWLAYVLSRWAFVEVLEYLSRFAILVAVVGFFLGRAERTKERHYAAWQVINLAQGKGGNGGRNDALHDLAADRVSLAGIDLSGAQLRGLHLRNADLGFSNLVGIVLNDADLTGTYVGWSEVSYDFPNARTTSFWKATLKWTNFTYSDLRSATFGCANLEQAKLEYAKMSGAWLVGADLKGADLIGADLSGTRLQGADLTGAFLVQGQIDKACVDDTTILPKTLHTPDKANPLCRALGSRGDCKSGVQP
jgi:uncharacterized protein YjbI with pentapeptide repeats